MKHAQRPGLPISGRRRRLRCGRPVWFALAAVALIGAVPGPASGAAASKRPARHPAKGHARGRRHGAPKGGFVLRGLSTEIVPLGGVGDISPPTPLAPAAVLARFGRPGPSVDHLVRIGRLGGAIVTIDYSPSDATAGVSFRFDGPPVNSLDGIAIASPAFRTPQGLHVGSTSSQVQAALPQARCDEYVCTLFATDIFGTVRVTAFDLFAGKVAQISLTGERSTDPF